MGVHFIKNFIRHYISATPIDVLHSPFVFDLYQTAIKKQVQKPVFEKIELCREQLKQNQSVINYTDLGAGSNILNKSIRKKVSAVAKTHLKPKRIAQIIHFIVAKYKCKQAVELGTSLGITASYIASALAENTKPENSQYTTIEGAPAIRQIALKQFDTLQLNPYINSVEGNFNDVLPTVISNYNNIDLFFVDGNHTYEATMHYFKMALPLQHNNSVFIFDDIYWSKGMSKAWQEIKQHPQVLQTVDLFFIGLVFFRQEQTPQHFKLRIL